MSNNRNARHRLLEACAQLCYQSSLREIGIDAIIERAGVARMSLYRHFRTKDDLLVEYLRWRDGAWRAWLRDSVNRLYLERREDPRWVQVFDVLDLWFRRPDFRGCLFINAAHEFADNSHVVRRVCDEHRSAVRAFFADLCVQDEVDNPQHVVDAAMLLYDGALTAATIDGDVLAAGRARAIALQLAHAARNTQDRDTAVPAFGSPRRHQ